MGITTNRNMKTTIIAVLAFASLAAAVPTGTTPTNLCVAGPGPCEHGAFRCTSTSTSRCNHGKWIDFPCAAGTKCVDYDYECVAIAEVPRVERQTAERLKVQGDAGKGRS